MAEWFGSRSRRMIMKVSATVHLIDDLTGLPVRGSNARVWIESQRPPIKKNDGVNIFCDLPEGEYTLIAEGGQYARTEVVCNITAQNCSNITLRLVPNKLYPVPFDAVRIEGKAFPEALVRIWQADRTNALKLLSDAAKGSSVIGIYINSDINISGKLLKIVSADDKGEYIRVSGIENKERSEYRLEEELTQDHQKMGTSLIQVCECRADINGDFMLMIKKGSGDKMVCETDDPDKKISVQKTIDIGDSKYIKMTFEDT